MGFTITPDELKKSAIQYRKELLVMMSIGLANSLQHMTLRTGVQYKQKVGQYDPNAQFGPYDPTRCDLLSKNCIFDLINNKDEADIAELRVVICFQKIVSLT